MTELGPGRSADPFEELAGPVDDVHGQEAGVALRRPLPGAGDGWHAVPRVAGGMIPRYVCFLSADAAQEELMPG